MALQQLLKERIVLMDGAMGTMIQKNKLSEEDFHYNIVSDTTAYLKGNNDLLNISRPDIIEGIHYRYLEAGAQILKTNTFNSNSISQSDYGTAALVEELNIAGAAVARRAIQRFSLTHPDRELFIAGAIGPTSKTASLSPSVDDPSRRAVTFDELVICFKQQVNGLIKGGVDLLLLETNIDTLNVKAALYAIMEIFEEKQMELPVMVSATITDASGRILSGQTIEAFLISVAHAPITSIGLNCALGAEDLRPYIEILSKEAPFYVSIHPNAGLPNEFGEYDQTPEEMSSIMKDFAERGWLNIAGGCCGTTPEHISALREKLDHVTPRKNPVEELFDAATVSATSLQYSDNFNALIKTIESINNKEEYHRFSTYFRSVESKLNKEQAQLLNAHLFGKMKTIFG